MLMLENTKFMLTTWINLKELKNKKKNKPPQTFICHIQILHLLFPMENNLTPYIAYHQNKLSFGGQFNSCSSLKWIQLAPFWLPIKNYGILDLGIDFK